MVSGWFGAYGKFRSDDVKTGDLLAYTGSTASVGYFPTQVLDDTDTHPIEYLVLSAPVFAGGQKVVVQQGAGMAVTKSDSRRELACVEFLRWFTKPENNIVFGASSGYLPVTVQAQQMDCIRFCIEDMSDYTYYSPQTFSSGSALRKVLEYGLSDKAAADIEAIAQAVAAGLPKQEVLKTYVSEEAFETWYKEFTQRLTEAAAQ